MKSHSGKAEKTIHMWSKEALLAKAQRYTQEMQAYSRDDWRFGLTSTFVLEFLARAALANISPTLLADSRNWWNLYYSLGLPPSQPKYIPRSIDTVKVLSHLRETVPTFNSELEGFSVQHISRRNEELHAGSTPFDGLDTNWLSRFYEAAGVLLASMGKDLAFLLGDDDSQIAKKLIVASKDESAKAVAKAVEAHKTLWKNLDEEEQTRRTRQASVWATRQEGHRVACPSCANDALVVGNPISGPIRRLEGDLIVETQEYLPAKFECVACQLKIAGLSQLNACGLGATYKSTSTFDAAEYYSTDDKYAGFDDDNNEY